MRAVAGYVEPPERWQRVAAKGAGPFVTHETFRHPDGHELHWDSRAHRKGTHQPAPGATAGRSIWWRPDHRAWWMAALFSVGSVCFAVGGAASQWAWYSNNAIAITFVIGSIFFTAAAYLQYAEAANAGRHVVEPRTFRRWVPASWEPKRIDWIACVIQLAGTVLFNISTIAALEQNLSASQQDLRIWAPNVFGSIAFLVSSELAYAEVCHRWFAVDPQRKLPWPIVAVNVLGSLAFGVSAVASLVEPASGHAVNTGIADAGTWIGALCFLFGAILLVPEALGHAQAHAQKAAAIEAAA